MKNVVGNPVGMPIGAPTRTGEFLAGLAARDIRISVDHDRLRCSAPPGALTPEFRDQIRDRKSEIISFLSMGAAVARHPAIVPLRIAGTLPPIYAVPGHAGAPLSFQDLARHLGDDQPFYALQPAGYDGLSEPMDRIEDIAAYFADQIREHRPDGPLVVAGYCSGAATAYELARMLDAGGADVRCLVMFGPLHPATYSERARLLFFCARGSLRACLREAAGLPTFADRLGHFADRLAVRLRGLGRAPKPSEDPVLASRERLGAAALAALRDYVPKPYRGRTCLVLPNRAWRWSGAAPHRWLEAAPGAEIHFGPDGCDDFRMLEDPDAPAMAELYRRATRVRHDPTDTECRP